MSADSLGLNKNLSSEVTMSRETQTEIIRTVETATENPNFTITEALETFKRSTFDFLQESFAFFFDKISSQLGKLTLRSPH